LPSPGGRGRGFSALTLPEDYVSIKVGVPSGIEIEGVDLADLPPDWPEEDPPLTTQEIGTAWLMRGSSLLLKVSSAVIPTEHTYLINPLHADFGRLTIGPSVAFRFDPRPKQ
jgi:RES domain-containing protein